MPDQDNRQHDRPQDRRPDVVTQQEGLAADLTAADDAAPQFVDEFAPIVAEIRERLQQIAEREAALDEREQALNARDGGEAAGARAATERELADERRRLEHQRQSLEAQSAKLHARQLDLEQQQADIAARTARLEQDRADIQRWYGRLRRRRETDRATRQSDRERMRAWQTEQHHVREELQRRLEQARDDIARQRQEIEQLRAQLVQRRQELDQRQQRLDRLTAEIEPLRALLQQQQRQISEKANEVTAAKRELERERKEFKLRQRELDDHWRRAREQRGQVAQRNDDVEALRRIYEQDQAELEQRQERVANQERELRTQAEALSQQRAELSERAAALTEREEELDALRTRQSAADDDLREERRALQLMREQVEAREAELRQTSLALEVQSADLVRAQDETSTAETAATPALIGRPWSPRRVHLVAAVVGLAAAVAVWLAMMPQYRTTLRMQVQTQSPEPHRAAQEHALQLTDPARIDAALADSTWAPVWAAIRDRGRLVARVADDATVELSLIGPRQPANAGMLLALSTPYIDMLNSQPAEPRLPPNYDDLAARRATVATDLNAAEEQQAALSAELETLADEAAITALAAEVAELRAARASAADELETRRSELTALQRQTPAGVVTTEALDEALAQDALYQEDNKELQLAAEQYQITLGVALLKFSDELAGSEAALQRLRATLTEQRDLTPPPAVAAVLDDAQAQADRCGEQLDMLTTACSEWRTAVEQLDAAAELTTLVDLHNAAIEASGRLATSLADLAKDMTTRATALAESNEAGTRGVVVAAVLRSDARQLDDAATSLATAANGLTPTENFELDAQSDKVRGLRTRLLQRRETIQGQLQAAADAKARREHEARVAELRSGVVELEDQREARLTDLLGKLDELERLNAERARRRGLEAEHAALTREVERLTTQAARLDDALAEASRRATHPDRITPPDAPTHEQIGGHYRWPFSGLAAGLGFGATWLLALALTRRAGG